jgi:hypothetical protein
MSKKKSSFSLASKVAILKIPPEAWDAIIPHGPKVSQHLVEYMVAGVVRDIGSKIKDKELQAKLSSIGKEIATSASRGLVQGWEDGDDICPPWPPFPWPWPWRDKEGPSPDPWKVKSVEQLLLADLLVSLAEVVTDADISAQLKSVALEQVKSVSVQLVADFEKTHAAPRVLRE